MKRLFVCIVLLDDKFSVLGTHVRKRQSPCRLIGSHETGGRRLFNIVLGRMIGNIGAFIDRGGRCSGDKDFEKILPPPCLIDAKINPIIVIKCRSNKWWMNATTYVFFGFGLLRIDQVEKQCPFRPLVQLAIGHQFRPIDGRLIRVTSFFHWQANRIILNEIQSNKITRNYPMSFRGGWPRLSSCRWLKSAGKRVKLDEAGNLKFPCWWSTVDFPSQKLIEISSSFFRVTKEDLFLCEFAPEQWECQYCLLR